MNKVRLKLRGVSEIVGSHEVALLVLTDEAEERQLSIVCDKAIAYQLSLRMGGAPVNALLLPEVLCGLVGDLDADHYEVLINAVLDGQYRAVLVNHSTLHLTSIRVSDAILLAQIARLPIYIEQSLMNRQSVEFVRDGSRGIAIPVNTLNGDMLTEALEKAVENENYELASQLRDELKRRTKS